MAALPSSLSHPLEHITTYTPPVSLSTIISRRWKRAASRQHAKLEITYFKSLECCDANLVTCFLIPSLALMGSFFEPLS